MKGKDIYNKIKLLGLILLCLIMLNCILYTIISMNSLIDLGSISSVIGLTSIRWATLLALVGTSIAFVSAVPGILAIYNDNEYLQIMYAWIMFLVAFIVSFSAFYSQDQSHLLATENSQVIQNYMNSLLMTHYGNPDYPEMKEAFDYFHKKHQCCGIFDQSVKHWTNSEFFKSQINFPRNRVPLSCCRTCNSLSNLHCADNTNSTDSDCLKAFVLCSATKFEYVDRDACLGHEMSSHQWPTSTYLQTDGCFEKIKILAMSYSEQLFQFGGVLFILSIAQFFTFLAMSWYLNDSSGFLSSSSDST